MRVIVPLAGPDFVSEHGSIKVLATLDRKPLLRHVLDSRGWAGQLQGEDYTFVLIDRREARAFADNHLSDWYPGSRKVFLSDYARGAALSVVAALSGHRADHEPLIIDLADIFYKSHLDPRASFAANPAPGAIAMTFQSDNPVYSYLATDSLGRFLRAAEKKVIAANASAGTYFFASTSVYLRALAHGLEDEPGHTFRDLFYVCPLLNGVLAQGREVLLSSVSAVRDIKTEQPDHQP